MVISSGFHPQAHFIARFCDRLVFRRLPAMEACLAKKLKLPGSPRKDSGFAFGE